MGNNVASNCSRKASRGVLLKVSSTFISLFGLEFKLFDGRAWCDNDTLLPSGARCDIREHKRWEKNKSEQLR